MVADSLSKWVVVRIFGCLIFLLNVVLLMLLIVGVS